MIILIVICGCKKKDSKPTFNQDIFFSSFQKAVYEINVEFLKDNIEFPLIFNDRNYSDTIFKIDIDTSRNFSRFIYPYIQEIKNANNYFNLNDTTVVYYNNISKILSCNQGCKIDYLFLKKDNTLRLKSLTINK